MYSSDYILGLYFDPNLSNGFMKYYVKIFWKFRLNPTVHQVLKVGDLAALQASNFNLSKPLKIFTHGWTQIGYDKGVVDGNFYF